MMEPDSDQMDADIRHAMLLADRAQLLDVVTRLATHLAAAALLIAEPDIKASLAGVARHALDYVDQLTTHDSAVKH